VAPDMPIVFRDMQAEEVKQQVSIEPVNALTSMISTATNHVKRGLRYVMSEILRLCRHAWNVIFSMLKGLSNFELRKLLSKFFLYVLRHPLFIPLLS